MTKRIARLALVLGAAAALAAPAAPAYADGCSATIGECVETVLAALTAVREPICIDETRQVCV